MSKRIVAPNRSDREILADIQQTYIRLSPEILACYGKTPQSEVLKRFKILNDNLAVLLQEIGREISESESFGIYPSANYISFYHFP